MVQKYKVTLTLTADDATWIWLRGRLGGSHEPEDREDRRVHGRPEARSVGHVKGAAQGRQKKRKSKVVDTILSTLKEGSVPAASLRSALAARGMSESSLSTGLSILQKSGQIERDPNGNYYLTAREAA